MHTHLMEQGIPLLSLPTPSSILRSRSPSPARSGSPFPSRPGSISPAPLSAQPWGTQSTRPPGSAKREPLFSPFRRLAFNLFLINASLCFTVPELFLSFRGLSCDLYYQGRVGYTGDGDACGVDEIEASSARELSWMLTIITVSSILNVFWTGHVTRKYGVKAALCIQASSPAIRNLFQQYALYHRGWVGIRILQYTQVFGVLGCGAGAVLTANTFTAELVAPEDRTPCFGILQGAAMAGSAVAFTLGGLTSARYGPIACFQVAFACLVGATLCSYYCLPYIPPSCHASGSAHEDAVPRDWMAWAAPLRTFRPRMLADGVRYYGLMCLGVGMFGGVVAVEFVPTSLQLVGASVYGFDAKHNGFLLSLNAGARALFLTIVYPRAIAFGRRRYNSTRFDLTFVRGSLLLDGLLTGLTAYAASGWNIYLAAFILPFASGTSSAAKGVIMELVPAAERGDALQAVSLLESLGQLCTVSIFGALFSALAAIGKPQTVFVWNAALALVSAGFLLLVRHPPSKAIELA